VIREIDDHGHGRSEARDLLAPEEGNHLRQIRVRDLGELLAAIINRCLQSGYKFFLGIGLGTLGGESRAA